MRRWLAWCGVLALLFACEGNVESVYDRKHHAYYNCQNVATISPLQAALTSPGEFCKITFTASQVHFSSADGANTATVNKTALDAYYQSKYISGFIVGTPTTTNLQTNNWECCAWDLVCPNCSEDDLINKPVEFNKDVLSKVTCPRCHRTYDLNLNGAVVEGEAGIKLFRYHLTYGNNSMVISN